MFEVKVLGSEPAWPSGPRACSGYLVRTAESTVLVDCGTGVFGRLCDVLAPEELTAVVISHLHFDHWVDLLPFRYYLSFEARPDVSPQLHLPPGAIQKLQTITEQIDPAPGFFADVFETAEYDPERKLRIRDLSITFWRTLHPIETYALRLVSGDKTLVYSADTGWDDSLAEFASGADLFICDATWGAGESIATDIHLTGEEAGRLATLSGAQKLLLTHLAELKAEDAVRAAQKEYSGPVEYAGAGRIFRA
jgi:ribonuclease BN (tRNA processing enzyme)